MDIIKVEPQDDFSLELVFEDQAVRWFDVKPLLNCEAFEELANPALLKRVKNRRYFIEWENGADLSADTLYARSQPANATGSADP